jgi:TaqI-like C-terminal specificity domain
LWLIYIPKNRVDIDAYPAIRRHLLPFKESLEKRATKQAWFELQQAQEAYAPMMAAPKIIYGHFSPEALFSHDANGNFSNDKSYIMPGGDWFLLGLLNSRPLWWLLARLAPAVRGGFHEVRVQYVETLPIPSVDVPTRARLATLAESAQRAAEARRDLQIGFRRRLRTDLAPGGNTAKLSIRLADWPTLDFKAFHDEVKKQFKQPIPLNERDDWQARFETDRAKVAELTAEIARCERAIDAEVYQLFRLTPAEIALIETRSERDSTD